MPAHDEAAIGDFIAEIDEHLRDCVSSLDFVVVDDASPLPLRGVLAGAGVPPSTTVLTNPVNLGHGPTALRAYAAGLATGADVVVHVDGDGQFDGCDFPPLVRALATAEVVHGERTSRDDPWFRRVVTGVLQRSLATASGPIRDLNTPLRGYRSEVLAELLPRVDARATVPHVHLSLLVRRLGLTVTCLGVRSRPRRGATATGTMWGPTRAAWLPSRRFVRFCLVATREVAGALVRRGAPVAPVVTALGPVSPVGPQVPALPEAA